MKRIVNKCPYYFLGDCIHPLHDLKPGYDVCDGNCYEEIEDRNT